MSHHQTGKERVANPTRKCEHNLFSSNGDIIDILTKDRHLKTKFAGDHTYQ
jgi:hypothetical protein